MSRIRTVKPEWMEDEQLLRAGSDARVLSVCLILLADDYGRGRFIPEVLAAQCFPFEGTLEDSSRVFREAHARLSGAGFVTLYAVRGQRYFEIANWTKHQKVDKPGKPRVPKPLDESRENSRESREGLAPDHDHDLERENAREQTADHDLAWARLGRLYQNLHDAEQEGSRNPRPYDEQRILSTDSKQFRKLVDLVKSEAARTSVGERTIFEAAARAFLRDDKQRAKGHVLEFFVRDFHAYVDRSDLEAAS